MLKILIIKPFRIKNPDIICGRIANPTELPELLANPTVLRPRSDGRIGQAPSRGEGACLPYNNKICGQCPRWLCGPLGPPGAPGKNGGLAAFFTAWRWNRPSARMTS